ncbi:hypothetical protein [Deminuibacter soli]|uniref:Uncharacterized protein n=1 Tax=Deminuibacter soli TaxID=2291815 RepID=A0A3E1NQ05_9BACT|nr:hypothetical protein [Deminuibacter soli]RFM30011.1 hypothetical protein DXN05_03295 [Deminuibacter soli]
MKQTVDTLLGNLDQKVRAYDQRVNYHADIHVGGCNFEFLVNDIPVLQHFGNANGTIQTSAPINTAILQPGPQQYKLILYPPAGQEARGLSENIETEITIEALRFREGGTDRVYPDTAIITPMKKINAAGDSIFADAGKPVAVYQGSFTARVPYQLQGWHNSQDLRKTDSSRLAAEVVAFYQQTAEEIGQGQLDKLAGSLEKSETEIAQALFYGKAEAADFLHTFYASYGRPDLHVQPLEHYKMCIYGDGKLVTLQRTDVKGKTPLWAKYKEGDTPKYFAYTLYLHKPQGSNRLEVIR